MHATAIYGSFICLSLLINSATAIQCYNCSSNKDIECSEQFDSDKNSLKPVQCDIYEGEYCIKTTGIFEGEMGTKRFCSSRDLGTFCEYVRRSGDDREYRSCIYTCSSDKCNSTINLKLNHFLIVSLVFAINFAAYF